MNTALGSSGDTGHSRSLLDRIEGDRLHGLRGWSRRVAFFVGVVTSVYHVIVLGFRPVDPWIFTAMHFFLASVLIFLFEPGKRDSGVPRRVGITDVSLIAVSAVVVGYILIDFEGLIDRSGIEPTTLDIAIGGGCLLVVLEATRRCAGLGLPILAVLFILYGLYGEHIPGLLGHHGYSFERLISFLYSSQGVYGVALNASAFYIFLFILFGALLHVCGASQLFIDLAMGTAGRYRGGSAKVSLVSSALFGTVSGSSVANVVVNGVMTIPMMKSTGFTAPRAAAIEAMNSIGGQILPPVMGIAAFLMADIMGIPYSEIIVAAIIPAFLYYLAAYCMIDFMAARFGLSGVREATATSVLEVLKLRGHLLLPLVILIYFLVVVQVSPTRSVLYAMLSLVLVSWLRSETRIDGVRLLTALYRGAEGALNIIPTCATAGIVVGILMLSGTGMKVGSIVIAYSYGSPLLALTLACLITLVLGMGVPTVAAYAIAASIAVPALVEIGIPELPAHFFVFYFAVLSGVTPPIALAAYTAATIARAPMSTTGFFAFRYCLAGFLAPFLFAYAPSILLLGTWDEIAINTVSATIGVVSLAAAIQGWLLEHAVPWERACLGAAALTLVAPGFIIDLVGYGLFSAIVLILWRRREHRKRLPRP